MQNTCSTVTHVKQKTNFFPTSKQRPAGPEGPFSKRFIAGSGLLEKLHFVQWRISEIIQAQTENVNVIRLAALLAAFPRMGCSAFNFSHNQLAKKFGELYQMPAPSRKSILKWEHALADLGHVQIPKHTASKAKTRVFTKQFWQLARVGLPDLSHTSVPVTWLPTYGDRQATPKDPTVSKNLETEKRAIEIDNKEKRQPRAESQIKKFESPPRYERRQPKKLDKFENSVMFWFFKQGELASYREGVILFGKFLQICQSDPYCRQLRKNWADCRDGSRPGLARNLIGFLRGLGDDMPGGEPEPLPPLQLAGFGDLPGDEPAPKEDPQVKALLATLLFKKPYRGRHPAIIKKFHTLDNSAQDQMLLQIMDGNLPTV